MIDDNDIKKLGEIFATKEDLEKYATREDLEKYATKEDLIEFKDEILNGQDEILGKLSILLDEKTIGDEQNKRQKKVLKIHNNALKRNKILTESESLEIEKSQVF